MNGHACEPMSWPIQSRSFLIGHCQDRKQEIAEQEGQMSTNTCLQQKQDTSADCLNTSSRSSSICLAVPPYLA